MDYLEQDPRSEARLSEQQPPTVLAVDVTSDAADLELLKASLTQARAWRCAASHELSLLLGMQPWSSVVASIGLQICSYVAPRRCSLVLLTRSSSNAAAHPKVYLSAHQRYTT